MIREWLAHETAPPPPPPPTPPLQRQSEFIPTWQDCWHSSSVLDTSYAIKQKCFACLMCTHHYPKQITAKGKKSAKLTWYGEPKEVLDQDVSTIAEHFAPVGNRWSVLLIEEKVGNWRASARSTMAGGSRLRRCICIAQPTPILTENKFTRNNIDRK